MEIYLIKNQYINEMIENSFKVISKTLFKKKIINKT